MLNVVSGCGKAHMGARVWKGDCCWLPAEQVCVMQRSRGFPKLLAAGRSSGQHQAKQDVSQAAADAGSTELVVLGSLERLELGSDRGSLTPVNPCRETRLHCYVTADLALRLPVRRANSSMIKRDETVDRPVGVIASFRGASRHPFAINSNHKPPHQSLQDQLIAGNSGP